MLETLRIQDYALIDKVDVQFQPGFNVLTGETGAGKSIIVGALNLVLGARANTDAVRTGASRARVDAAFRLTDPSPRLAALLEEHGIELEDGTLIVARVVTAEGRSRGYVGGNLVPNRILSDIGDELVDMHGQHEHQSLLKSDRQLELIDSFAGTDGLRGEVGDAVRRLRQAEARLAELKSDDRERARRVEFLRFECEEIDAAGLEPGEEEELRARRKVIANAERLFELAGQVSTALYEGEESSAVDAADTALTALEELAGIDPEFASEEEALRNAREVMADISERVRQRSETFEFDPDELDRVNERLDLVSGLKRKYGDSIAEILEYMRTASQEVRAYEQRDEDLEEARGQRDEVARECQEKARKLSEKRSRVVRKLDRQVTGYLQDLGMKGGRFETRLTRESLTQTGLDRVDFMLAANPGETIKPLRQIASGGEMSRIMLALKAVFAHADAIPTLIFDEIDAGVGGQVANSVARKMRDLAASHQTISITHLPQIAAAADAHYHVAKAADGKRTITTLAAVSDEQRVRELARLLDGSVSDVSVRHAEELLKASRAD